MPIEVFLGAGRPKGEWLALQLLAAERRPRNQGVLFKEPKDFAQIAPPSTTTVLIKLLACVYRATVAVTSHQRISGIVFCFVWTSLFPITV